MLTVLLRTDANGFDDRVLLEYGGDLHPRKRALPHARCVELQDLAHSSDDFLLELEDVATHEGYDVWVLLKQLLELVACDVVGLAYAIGVATSNPLF
jgi:hypothetical protein